MTEATCNHEIRKDAVEILSNKLADKVQCLKCKALLGLEDLPPKMVESATTKKGDKKA